MREEIWTQRKVAMVDAEYELAKADARQKGTPTRVTVRSTERRAGLKLGQLLNYRANHLYRRKK